MGEFGNAFPGSSGKFGRKLRKRGKIGNNDVHSFFEIGHESKLLRDVKRRNILRNWIYCIKRTFQFSGFYSTIELLSVLLIFILVTLRSSINILLCSGTFSTMIQYSEFFEGIQEKGLFEN